MGDLKEVVEKNSGILLDIGCGENKNKGFVGMDKRPLEGVDIVHDHDYVAGLEVEVVLGQGGGAFKDISQFVYGDGELFHESAHSRGHSLAAQSRAAARGVAPVGVDKSCASSVHSPIGHSSNWLQWGSN